MVTDMKRRTAVIVVYCLINALVLVSSQNSQPLPCDSSDARSISVPENIAPGEKVGEFRFVGPANLIQVTSESHEFLSYNPQTYAITSKKAINAEVNSQVAKLEVACKDIKIGVVVNYLIAINVVDVNEFPPEFEKNEYRVTIIEATKVDTVIFTGILAKDTDATPASVIEYSIVAGVNSEYFKVPIISKGEVAVAKPLDLDKKIDITLTIQAKEVRTNPKTSTCKLIVTVIDLDDEPPVFTQASYTGTISASAKMGDVVTLTNTIAAVDGDKGLNTGVEYTVQPSPGIPGYFTVNKKTAVVSLASLGIQAGQNYIVLIKAAQVDKPTKRYAVAPLVVTVQGSTSNQVQLAFTKSEYLASIPENHPPGADVITVRAVSSDQKSPTYQIVQASSHPNFQIDGNSGTVSLRAQAVLDYEKTIKYQFSVKATLTGKDAGSTKEITSKVVVNILNINDHDPKFLQNGYRFKVSKPRKGMRIGLVKAEDADGDKCSYSVQSYTEVFAIAPTGEISLRVEPNQLKQGSFFMVVACIDSGKPPRQGTTTVDVLIGNGTASVVSAGVGGGAVDIVPLIVLAALCGILLLLIIILVIHIHKRGNELKREKAHKQNISNLSIFGDSTTDLRDDGATTVQENPLAMENPGYFYMMKSDTDLTSPTNDYSVSEVHYPNGVCYANGNSTFTGNGSLSGRGGKRVKIQDQNESLSNGHPADPKITVYF